jgi:hypothetical protein
MRVSLRRVLIPALIASWPTLSTFITLIIGMSSLKPQTGFSLTQWALIALFVGFSGLAAANDVRKAVIERMSILYGTDEIDEYLHDWISCDGHVAVFSHDLTWVDRKRQNMELLEEKSRRNELTLFVPNHNEISKHLRDLGAKVYTYSALQYVPQSRFTIKFVGTMGSRVTIGHAGKQDQWIIEEFSSGDHPAYHLAHDLTEIITRMQTRNT